MRDIKRILAEEGLTEHRSVEARGPGYVGEAVSKAVGQVDTALGGVYYRLYGDGSDVPMSPVEKRKIEAIYQELKEAKRALTFAYKDLRNIDLQFSG